MEKSHYLKNTHTKNSAIFLILITLFALWGTGWSVPVINISIPAVWYLLIVFLLAVQFKYVNLFNDWTGVFIVLILILLCIYSLLALPQILSSSDYDRDLKYLLLYDLKFFVAVGSLFVFYKVCSSFNDLEFQLKLLSITFFILYIFLHWKYYYVYEKNYLGVEISGTGSRSGKNSLAIATAIVAPFLLAFLFSTMTKWNKVIGFLGVAAIIGFTINLQSRSMVIVLIVGLLSMILFMKNRKLRRILIGSSLMFVLLVSSFNIDYLGYIYKQNEYEEEPITYVVQTPWYEDTEGSVFQKFLNTHRGWLLSEAISGFKDSYLLGNGVSTFRIRDSSRGSRTETHNDYTMILYEQGIFGFLALLLLIFYRIKRTIKANRVFSDNMYITASLASLFGLSTSLFFTNLYNTQVFWVVIALNYIIVEKLFNIRVNSSL